MYPDPVIPMRSSSRAIAAIVQVVTTCSGAEHRPAIVGWQAADRSLHSDRGLTAATFPLPPPEAGRTDLARSFKWTRDLDAELAREWRAGVYCNRQIDGSESEGLGWVRVGDLPRYDAEPGPH